MWRTLRYLQLCMWASVQQCFYDTLYICIFLFIYMQLRIVIKKAKIAASQTANGKRCAAHLQQPCGSGSR